MNKVNNYIKKLKAKYLSGNELLKIIKKKARIVSYPDIIKYKSLDQLLGKHKAVIILYEIEPNIGHWVTLFKTKKGIEFFDPYGYMIDDELTFIPKKFRDKSNQDKRYLTRLIYESKYPVEYNHTHLQSDNTDVATCGRHIVTRLLFRKVPLKDYVKLMKAYKGFTPDTIVTLLTQD